MDATLTWRELFLQSYPFLRVIVGEKAKPKIPTTSHYFSKKELLMVFEPKEATEIAFILDQRMSRPVEVFLFSAEDTPHGVDSLHIVSSVAELCSKVILHTVTSLDDPIAQQYGIQRMPAMVIKGIQDYGIVRYGVPVGYDFAGFLNTLIEVSEGKADLCPTSYKRLTELKSPIRLKVFVGARCPFCPIATHFATQFSIASDLISSETINTNQFPDLVDQYQIKALPTVIINEQVRMVGIPAETTFLDHIFETEQSVSIR